jgi:hypothetical protein
MCVAVVVALIVVVVDDEEEEELLLSKNYTYHYNSLSYCSLLKPYSYSHISLMVIVYSH